MSRRFKSATRKFGLPLVTAESKRVFHCYASEGKGYGFAAGPRAWPTPVRILLVNAARGVRWEDGLYSEPHHWECNAVAGQDGWRRLGWTMPDDSLPFGDLDAVDPELTQFDYLPGVNSPRIQSASAHCFPQQRLHK
jgi:hypothetical protein